MRSLGAQALACQGTPSYSRLKPALPGCAPWLRFAAAGLVLFLAACSPQRPAPPPVSAVHPAYVEGTWTGRDDRRWSFTVNLRGPAEGFAATAQVADPRGRATDYTGTWGEVDGQLMIALLRREAPGAKGPQWFHLSGLALPRVREIELTSRDDTCSCTATVRLAR